MISRIRGTPIMKEITIMKTAGRLFSNIEFITVVALTALAPVMVVGGGAGVGPAAGTILEIFCKAFVALVNAAVVFSKALVVFSNLSLTVADIAPPVTFVVLLLVSAPPVVVFLRGSVAFGAGEAEVVATAAFSDNKLVMHNRDRDTRIIALTVFIYTLFVLFVV
ncbi:MAG TPA: hypothetical protein VKA91_11460 [Nitrososphaeraceae archaeon]|nr:hypothetical protein [Nitrososphaeraceae archaeon]